jgi:hypothetical protein
MKKLNRALEVPTTRGDPDSGYTLHGRRFDDPYAWLERLDDAETQAWIAAQEAVTHAVLRAAPGRDWLRAAVARSARSARYARLSPPIAAGPHGREFLCRVGRGGPPNLRRRPGEGVLMLRQGPRVPPLRRALQVGLRACQRRLPAASGRRRVRASGSHHAVAQPGAGDRRRAAHPYRPRCAARSSLRRAAHGADGVADAHPRKLGHAASGHGGAATLTTLVEQDVDELSFYCWALDVAPPAPGELKAGRWAIRMQM